MVRNGKRATWEPFQPLRLREFGHLCAAYLNSCYSKADAHYLIGSAFEAGASKLALNIMCSVANADSVILWIYHPEAHYFRAETIVGAAPGRYVTPIDKGIVGQLSPSNRHFAIDTTMPGSPQPFHPDLFHTEHWERVQYVAICFEGALIGAVGWYWRTSNRAEFLSSIDTLRMATLANVMLTAEQSHLKAQHQLQTLEGLIIRLAPAQALVSFLHDIQHSLRDVTTAMSTAAVLLDKSSSPERKALSAQLSQSADFVDGCVNRMARLALLQEKVVNHKRTDLQLLLRNMTPVLISYGAVKVSVKPGSTSVWIRADRLSLERAILNLVTNAVYWTEAKLHGERSVRVILGSRDGIATIDVEDTGIGVGAEVRDRIFDKFVSGRPDSGTGMGLYIVREIMRSHGGDVTFFTNRQHGTTFRLTFPLAEAK